MGGRVNALAKLGAEVSTSLESARVSHDAASRVREKLAARRASRFRAPRRLRRGTILGGLVLAAAIAAGVSFSAISVTRRSTTADASTLTFVVGKQGSENPGTTGTFLAAPPSAEVPVTFSDGSKVNLGPAARARVAELAHHGARVLVESGTVHVSVVHKDDTKWAVEAGPFEVRVTGTRFDLVWDPEATSLVVRLREGSVFVRGCGLLGDEGRRLSAGEELDVSCKERSLRVTSLDAESQPASAEPTVEANALPAAAAVASATAAPAVVTAPRIAEVNQARSGDTSATQRVIELARGGAHTEALMAAEANGFASTCDSLSGPELLLLADAARYASRFERASEALEAVRRRFPGSDAAATAAFELGRIAMDVRRDASVGAEHFETYLRERRKGSLAREALGRALEARLRVGDRARAEMLAARYLAAYPDGPHAKLARKLTPDPGSDP